MSISKQETVSNAKIDNNVRKAFIFSTFELWYFWRLNHLKCFQPHDCLDCEQQYNDISHFCHASEGVPASQIDHDCAVGTEYLHSKFK